MFWIVDATKKPATHYIQQIDVEGHIRTCGGGNFKIMPFFAIREDSKILKESYETYFIKKFETALNKRHKQQT